MKLRFLILTLSLINFGFIANASLILQPIGVSSNVEDFYPAIGLINQSGLSSNYVSLVDNFSSYMSSDPLANHGVGKNLWGSAEGIRTAHLDFDLGGAYLVNSFALWNLVSDPSAIRDFELMIDDNSSFSSPILLGTFTASNTLGYRPNTAVEVFDLAKNQGTHIRLNILNTWDDTSYSIAFNEVAFGVESIPEPASMTLLLCAGSLLYLRRNKKERTRTWRLS